MNLKITAAIKENVNNEDSIIIVKYSEHLRKMFYCILMLGIPFFIYMIVQFSLL